MKITTHLICFFFILSCVNDGKVVCTLKHYRNDSIAPPYIITKQINSNCSYDIEGFIFIKYYDTYIEGEMYFKDRIFQIRIKKINGEKVNNKVLPLFDMNKQEGDKYIVKKKNEYFFSIKVQNIIVSEKFGKVYLFRQEKAYNYEDIVFLDAVYFISQYYGVIGSYLTGKENDGTIFIASERGNILRDKIKYKKGIFGKLE